MEVGNQMRSRGCTRSGKQTTCATGQRPYERSHTGASLIMNVQKVQVNAVDRSRNGIEKDGIGVRGRSWFEAHSKTLSITYG